MKRIKLEAGSAVYHCIGRINGGAMLLGDEEKEYFRKLMWKSADFYGVEILTYCVMSNHVHLLLRLSEVVSTSDKELCRRMNNYYGRTEVWAQVAVDEFARDGRLSSGIRKILVSRMGDVSQFMRTLKQRFSTWYNNKHERFGTLWAERFKSVLVQDSSEALQTVAMYIDLNPVRAGIVEDPKDYRFCGYAEAVAGKKLARMGILGFHGRTNWRKAHAEYRCTMMVYAGEANSADKAVLDRESILEVLKNGGHLEPAEVLRLRLRYFSDGLVFGSREYVNGIFEEFRDRFGPSRTTGARVMRGIGSMLGDLTTARDLRVRLLG